MTTAANPEDITEWSTIGRWASSLTADTFPLSITCSSVREINQSNHQGIQI